jgi:hypothetical protein
MRVRCLLLALALVLLPGESTACPVCFQGLDAPLLDSARAGVLAMALVLVGVLGVLGRWFVRLARLEAAAAREDDQ